MNEIIERAEQVLQCKKAKALYYAEQGVPHNLTVTAYEWLTLIRAFNELKERGVQR